MHVGAGKCGSSSLQSVLSKEPVFYSREGTRYEYVSLKKEGILKRGEECLAEAKKSAFGYTSSVSVRDFFSEEAVPVLASRLKAIADEGVTPVFSYEGWINESARFSDRKVFEKLGLTPHIVIFVRPQVPWINSSWWQWGAWSGKEFPVWANKFKKSGLWAETVAKWNEVPAVRNVTVFPVSRNVVESFYEMLGADLPFMATQRKSNVTLDAGTLRLFQKYRKTRAEKLGAGIDFVLERNRVGGNGSAPWVLESKIVSDLIDFFREDNKVLLSLVDEEIREGISGDAQWWEASAFSSREAEPPGPVDLDPRKTGEIAIKAIAALARLDKKARAGKRSK
ncbi:MAG: hypothetical protein ABJP66_01440 [Hyphomicrobiales bacterium]